MSQETINPTSSEAPDFSAVLGGPLYQLLLRLRIAKPPLDLVRRRIIVISLLAWLPLLPLAAVSGRLIGGVKVPLIYDIEAHARFLLALPLLIVAELLVHMRSRPIAQQFLERNIIPPHERPKFNEIIASCMRLRNSVVAEVTLFLIVLTAGHVLWNKGVALQSATWYADFTDSTHQLTLAGKYYAFVSMPIFQFILLRWYFRLFIWSRFLFKVSKLDLHLIPTHPDRAGGLSFVLESGLALSPLVLAHGALLGGLIANRIFYEGAKLPAFKFEIIAMVLFMLLLALGPLLVFVPVLARTRRLGLREYGRLASRYVAEFDQKWLRQPHAPGEPLLGSADIQSLADLNNGFNAVREMRFLLFDRAILIRLIVTTLLPMAPLVLTMIPLNELLERLLQTLL